LTPEEQLVNLKLAISELDAKIEAREGELVAAQVGMMDGEVDDLELIGLYELRRKFLKKPQERESVDQRKWIMHLLPNSLFALVPFRSNLLTRYPRHTSTSLRDRRDLASNNTQRSSNAHS